MTVARSECDLLAAWRSWEEMPGEYGRACRLEALLVDVAARNGTTAGRIREDVTAARRGGADLDEAIALST